MFLILMVAGLAGLGVMALPALGRHASHGTHGMHAMLRAGQVTKLAAVRNVALARPSVRTLVMTPAGMTRFIPSPRLAFSLLALYGAFGNVLAAAGLATLWAGLAAILPAAIIERFAVTPLWRLLFKLDGRPSAPLEELVMSDATAVTPFRAGRGIVSIVRDGRLVQFSARLADTQAELPVRVGDKLRVEDIDAARERVTVSVVREAP
jgi:hypothetical protein